MPSCESVGRGKAAFHWRTLVPIEPVQNRTQVSANKKRRPLGLYSHSARLTWQTTPAFAHGIFWGVVMADLRKSLTPTQPFLLNISLDGTPNVFNWKRCGIFITTQRRRRVLVAGINVSWHSIKIYQNAFSAAVDSQLTLQYRYPAFAHVTHAAMKQASRCLPHFAPPAPRASNGASFRPAPTWANTCKIAQCRFMSLSAIGAITQTFFMHGAVGNINKRVSD